MQLNINNLEGAAAGELELSDAVFSVDFREPLVHQVVVAHMAAARAGTSAQKNRSAVQGGNSKPWRQKGTGRARAGTIRSPLFRGGGRVFPASTRSYAQKVNRKMYRGAMRAILSELIRTERLKVVDNIDMDAPKTRTLVDLLGKAGYHDVLFVLGSEDRNVELSARNIVGVDVVTVGEINPVVLLSRENVVVVGADTMKRIEESLQ